MMSQREKEKQKITQDLKDLMERRKETCVVCMQKQVRERENLVTLEDIFENKSPHNFFNEFCRLRINTPDCPNFRNLKPYEEMKKPDFSHLYLVNVLPDWRHSSYHALTK